MRCGASHMLVSTWVLVLGSRLLAGEVTNADLLAEMKAMRAAYEGRISALESKIKEIQTERTDQKRVVEIHKGIDKALGEDSYRLTRVERSEDVPGTIAVKSTTNMTMGGYSEFAYTDRGDRTKEFDQAKTVLEVGAQLHERIRFYSEFEWEHGGVIEGGGEGNGEWELEQAWVDLQFSDAINFRAGQIIVPIGRYNLYHEGWINNFVDRPLVDREVIPTTFYEEGAGLHGQVLDTNYLGISYEAYVFNPGRANEITTDTFHEFRNEGNQPVYRNNKAGAFRVAFEPARSLKRFADLLEIGVSGYVSGFNRLREDDAKVGSSGTVQIFALDGTYEKSFKKKGTLGVRAEAAMTRVSKGYVEDAPRLRSWGYYAEAYYSFWPGFLTKSAFGREFKDPRLVFAVRYDWADTNIDSFNRGDMSRTTVGLSYRPTNRVVYKLDYQMDHSPSRTGGPNPESGDGSNTDALLFGVSVGF